MRLTYRSVTPSSFAIAEVDGAPPEKSLSFHLYALVSALISVALGRGCSSRAWERQDRTVLAPGGGGEDHKLGIGKLGHEGLLGCRAPHSLRRFHPRRPRRSPGRGGRA